MCKYRLPRLQRQAPQGRFCANVARKTGFRAEMPAAFAAAGRRTQFFRKRGKVTEVRTRAPAGMRGRKTEETTGGEAGGLLRFCPG